MKLSSLVLASVMVPALAPTALPQDSRGVFDAANVVLDRDVPPLRRMLDFDLDGDPDGVGAWLNSNKTSYRLYAYRNDGQGDFIPASQVTVSAEAVGTNQPGDLLIEVGHLNDDPWPDVCILFRRIRHDWLGQGNGTFVLQPTVPLPGPSRDLVLVDLDGDGIDDVVWLDGGRLGISSSLGVEGILEFTGVKRRVRVLPADGPGGSDVFLVHVNRQVRVFFGTSTEGLTEGPVYAHDVNDALMDTGDIDGDGDEDAVIFGPLEYRVLRRTGEGTWDIEPFTYGGPAEFLRDVDGDGDLDGACCGGGGGGGGPTYPNDNTAPTEFQIAINDGTGAFAPAFQLPGLGSPQLAGVLDVDGDGDADLVAGRCVFLADGQIRPPRDVGTVPPIHGRRALSDCDGDGDMDVGFSVTTVHTNDGYGRFSEEVTAPTAPPGTQFAGPGYQGDFDGDGDVDLVVEVRSQGRTGRFPGPLPGHSRPISMGLLRNAGGGELLPAVPAAPRGIRFAIDSHDPELSLLVDADQDGDLDLLTRSLAHTFQESGTRLWANDGAGFFRPGGEQPYSRALWAGDVDVDGDLDLILNGAGYEGTSTYLYLGSDPVPGRLPTLTWDSRPGYWPQQAASGIEAVDFDQDGYVDFVTLHTAPSAFVPSEALYLNEFGTNGTLEYRSWLGFGPTLAHGARVSMADLDGNDTFDGVIGPLDDEQVPICGVLTNQLAGPVTYESFESTLQLIPPGFLVDLDGDGDADLIGDRIVFNRSNP